MSTCLLRHLQFGRCHPRTRSLVAAIALSLRWLALAITGWRCPFSPLVSFTSAWYRATRWCSAFPRVDSWAACLRSRCCCLFWACSSLFGWASPFWSSHLLALFWAYWCLLFSSWSGDSAVRLRPRRSLAAFQGIRGQLLLRWSVCRCQSATSNLASKPLEPALRDQSSACWSPGLGC